MSTNLMVEQSPCVLCCAVLCCAVRCLQKGDAASKLAISDLNSPAVYFYDVASGSESPIATLEKLHTAPVKVMRFNAPANTVISSDAKGTCTSLSHNF
jgi:peptidylprolyl isomerase domain and WD repeat-containing protein 1